MAPTPASDAPTIWSLGHSNRPFDAFVRLLADAGIRSLVDVRATPYSRRWPHFNKERMEEGLESAHVEYHWLPALGGRRGRPRPDSPHTGWTVDAFRAYADYMESETFGSGLEELIAIAKRSPTAFMCAEALPVRCHRRLIADNLASRGWRVLHVESAGAALIEHRYPTFLRIVDGRLLYDGPAHERSRQGSLPFG